MSIDTHIHLFHRGLPRAQGIRHDPAYDAPLDQLLLCATGTSVDRFVIVQPSFLGTDNQFLLDQLQRYPALIAGVAVLDPGVSEDEIEQLARLGIRGIRLNLLGRELSQVLSAETLSLVARCAEHGLHIELHDDGARLPQVLALVAPLAKTLVIDHFGRPNVARGGLQSNEFQTLLNSGEGKDWYVKISAPYRCPGIDVYAAWQNFLQHWGPERLLWGSDWPWTQNENYLSYTDWCRPFDAEGDLPARLEGNALRLYGNRQ
ncbi:amidohydrolase family protein [Castellaniella sp.]|uniref:amidohydrolase family protein n=1 Tax=Castellaniella sp. TaxID=1955812 RepID=UPI003A920517